MLTITLLSLIVAAVSGFSAWLSIRRERLRSTARVASLAAAIDNGVLPSADADINPLEHVFELDFRSEQRSSPFEAFGAERSMRRGLLTVIGGAAVVIAGVVTIAMMSDGYDAPKQAAVAPPAQSLELLSLRADRDGSALAISGLVRSRADEPMTSVTAVVSAIDAHGRPIGRGSAPLAAILPQRESRFLVTISDVSEAARYRVSFRGATGVIRHVDRRVQRDGNVL
jgi:hypothetical protein